MLFDVDDLELSGTGSSPPVTLEVLQAKRAVKDGEIRAWLRERKVIPTVVSLYSHAETIRENELARSGLLNDGVSNEERQALDALTRAIVKKLLHQPVTRLKRAARNGDCQSFHTTLHELFALDEQSVRT